ncbi:MAG: FTR1 family protein [Solibacillus sp.]
MKHFLQVFSLCIFFVLSSNAVQAATSAYSEIYVLITDGLIGAKQNNEQVVNDAIAEITVIWATMSSDQKKEKDAADAALQAVVDAQTTDERTEAFSNLSKAISALDLAENPIDVVGEREKFEMKYRPFMKQWEEAYASGDLQRIHEAYKMLDVKWNQYEQPVRSQSIGLYGKIENQMAFMRIALANEVPDTSLANSYYEAMKSYIELFLSGEDFVVEDQGYSLQTLVNLINDALKAIDNQDNEAASAALTEFIIVWPNVEIEVSTRNGSLYNVLESKLPILVSQLMQINPDNDAIVTELQKYKTEIQLLQDHDSYTFWDSALILLREGLEAILIIMVLVSFLKRSNQERMVKWIYTGAVAGVLLSVAAAVALSYLFNALTAATSREMIEGWIGLAAAMMMIGVGIWLHNKSSVESWNAYLSKQMGSAMSTGSVISMASISFLSVFREGAETILFYAGIIPKMEMFDFALGIVVALVILIIVAFVLFKLSVKIPIHRFFFVATIFIYILAFKIIGTSIHTLQLTNVFPTTIIHELPVISAIGFYPTVETMSGQVILLLVWAFISWKQRKK